MNLRTLLIVNAALAAFHGVGFIFAPAQLLALYQIPGSPGAELMGQLFGAQLLVVAVITWLGRDLTDFKAHTTIILSNLIADIVGTVVCVKAVLGGVMGAFGWLAVAIYGVLAIAYLIVYMQRGGNPAPAT